jgi:serine/threonine-protein kinase HipA
MKNNRCYICYESIAFDLHFHPACLKKLFGENELPEIAFNEQHIESMALELIKQKKGIPGVQKKLSLSLTKTEDPNQTIKRLTIVGYLGGNYILKPPTHEYPFMPEIEDLTMHLAKIAKLKCSITWSSTHARWKISLYNKTF